MKAIVYHNYGSPEALKYEEVEKPKAGDNQVLIKVHAASLNLADYARLKGVPFLIRLVYPRARADGILSPKDPQQGRDVAGEVGNHRQEDNIIQTRRRRIRLVFRGLCGICIRVRVGVGDQTG